MCRDTHKQTAFQNKFLWQRLKEGEIQIKWLSRFKITVSSFHEILCTYVTSAKPYVNKREKLE
jgi:hypothetical protein